MPDSTSSYEEVTSSAQLTSLLEHKQSLIDLLLEITEAINRNFSAQDLFTIYSASLKTQFDYNKIKFLYNMEGEWMVYNEDEIVPYLSDHAIQELMTYTDISFIEAGLSNDFDVVIPVNHKDEPLAFVLVDGLFNHRESPLEEELRFLQTVTNITVIAMENKRLFNKRLEQEVQKKEIDLAIEVQKTLIPSDCPDNENYGFAAQYTPFKGIGGDYFDIIPHPKEDSIFFCIADVAGKGISAALVMANFQANLRAAINKDLGDKEFFQFLNKKVFDITKGERFITLFMAKLEFKRGKLLYVNAGHEPSILRTPTGTRLLDKGCPVLGAFEELPFIEIGEEDLVPKTTIFTYTDGLTDLMNNNEDQFSMERLMTFIEENDFDDPNELNAKLMDELDIYRGDLDFNDDICFLTCRVKSLD